MSAVCSWIEAIGALSRYYQGEFRKSNRSVLDALAIEEANLLHARRLARRNQMWDSVTSCMQGLHVLYDYQGRLVEWARLVEEIRCNYCTADDQPVPGREDEYTLVMDYRVRLARYVEFDVVKAAALQEKCVEWDRQKASAAVNAPEEIPLSENQRIDLRNLALSVGMMGQILREAGAAEGVERFQEQIRILRRIGDKASEAIAEYHLGIAYLDISCISDVDAAEAALQRSLDLHGNDDHLGRSKCIQGLGRVYYARFRETRKLKDPGEMLLRHAESAERLYLEALQLCPKDSLDDLATLHHQIGTLYSNMDELDEARKQYERAVQYYEQMGNHHDAGGTRFNMGVMYTKAALRQEESSQRRVYLVRASAYAQAALRDFQYYEGRAANNEAKAQRLIEAVNMELANLVD